MRAHSPTHAVPPESQTTFVVLLQLSHEFACAMLPPIAATTPTTDRHLHRAIIDSERKNLRVNLKLLTKC